MKVKPIIVLGATQLAALEQALRTEVEKWVAEWLPSPAEASLRVTVERQGALRQCGDDAALRFATADGESWIVFEFEPPARSALGAALLAQTESVSTTGGGRLSEGLVREALTSLARYLLTLESPPAADEQGEVAGLMPVAEFSLGQGVLRCELGFAGCELTCWLCAAAAVKRIETLPPGIREQSAPVTAATALSRQKLKARVTLGEAELTLEALRRLRVGDVIQLDTPLHDPLLLKFDQSPVRFDGYLGRQQDRLVFRVDRLRH